MQFAIGFGVRCYCACVARAKIVIYHGWRTHVLFAASFAVLLKQYCFSSVFTLCSTLSMFLCFLITCFMLDFVLLCLICYVWQLAVSLLVALAGLEC